MTLDIRNFFQATNPSRTLAVENEEDRKYYIDFSSVRGWRIIEELKDNIALWSPDEPTCDLFTGHIGCGKSAELLRLKADLEQEGFHVVYFESSENLEMGNVDVGIILLAIAHRVSKSLEDFGVSCKSEYFQNLFNEIKEILQMPIELSDMKFSVGIAAITAQAKANPKQLDKLHGFLEPRTNGIIEAINQDLLEPAIAQLKHQGKNGLVVIVDNLDRVDFSQKPWGRLQPEYLFVDRGAQLRGLHCHVVYTMPLALRFSHDYATLIQRMGYPKVLQMVPVRGRDGHDHEEGMAQLRQMVLARAFPDLAADQRIEKVTAVFDQPETLDRLCRVSGGHVWNLMSLLNDWIKKEQKLPLSLNVLEAVIRARVNELVLPITDDEWGLLRQVAKFKYVAGDTDYQKLIRSGFVYEYSDQDGSWFDINPILAEALDFKLNKEQQILNRSLLKAQQFFRLTGAKTSRQENILRVTSVSGGLKSYTPLPVMFAEQPVDQDVLKLKRHAAQLREARQPQTGLLLYQKQPDALFRLQMAEVRLRDHFILIPIPFAAVEQALIDEATSIGLLTQYIKRYMPDADLFDDRNAIGDTLSFYGRVNLLHSLEEDLCRCQGLGLFGIRKSGKTSVLLQLEFSMRRHPVVYIDLQPYGGKLRYGAELFNKILQKLSNLLRKNSNQPALKFDLFEHDCPAKEIATDFTQQVCNFADAFQKAKYKVPIICFLDEIERILPTQTDPKERVEEFNAFFGALRELSQTRQRLSLLCADVHSDFNRINHWSQTSVPTNPVFQFFKEVFISPFSPEETTTMLTEIGQIMGVEFDRELLEIIYQDSGGHPFIARQLASLLWKKATKEKRNQIELITLAAAKRYLNSPFKYLDILKAYFRENIWADLEKRNFDSAMTILRLLACNEELSEGVAEEILLDQLSNKFTKNDCESALLWLENVGLIVREELGEEDRYRLEVLLLSRWLRREMKPEEMSQWRIHSDTLD